MLKYPTNNILLEFRSVKEKKRQAIKACCGEKAKRYDYSNQNV
jgi:hypothetical protein